MTTSFRTVFFCLATLTALACSPKGGEGSGGSIDPSPAVAAVPAPAQPPAGTVIAIPKITISADAAAIEQGKGFFASKGCIGCHKIGGGKLVGPDLKGVTARRDQEWIEKMILRPDVMTKEDATAKKLLAEHMLPMPNQNVDPEKELPGLLAYLKSNEK